MSSTDDDEFYVENKNSIQFKHKMIILCTCIFSVYRKILYSLNKLNIENVVQKIKLILANVTCNVTILYFRQSHLSTTFNDELIVLLKKNCPKLQCIIDCSILLYFLSI